MPTARLSVWLVLGGLSQVFGFGKWVVPLAAWLALVFLLRFTRGMPPVTGLVWVWAALIVALSVANRGVMPIPEPGYFGAMSMIALTMALPYLVDRLLAPRFSGVPATLVFPVAWTTTEFLSALFNPFGTWGVLGYTQHGNLPVMQLVSVTGIWGIGFLMAWFAATVNAAWQFKWKSVRAGVLLYAAIWGAVTLAGGLRLAFAPEAPTVRIAGIGWPKAIAEPAELVRAIAPDITSGERRQLRKTFARLQDSLLERSRRETQAGARIIVWPEGNLLVFHDDEASFLDRARGFAREQNIFLLMGMGVLEPGAARPVVNQAVLLSPAGGIEFSYVKITAVPGPEARTSFRGQKSLPVADTPYGRMTAAICFDLDFPRLIRQVGRARADLLLVPAADWRAITALHQHMAEFRAVENGVTMFRITHSGGSAAVDPYGRRLASMDDFTTRDSVLVAQVPMSAGVHTIYSAVGDLFAWLCVGALIAILGSVVSVSLRGAQRRRSR